MNGEKIYLVKATLANGQIVEIALDFEKLDRDQKAADLIDMRLAKGRIPYVCRGKYCLEAKSVIPRIALGKPQILDVHEATTDSLIDAVYRDQYEIDQIKRIWGEMEKERRYRTKHNLHGRDWS